MLGYSGCMPRAILPAIGGNRMTIQHIVYTSPRTLFRRIARRATMRSGAGYLAEFLTVGSSHYTPHM
jgi:hypothetical protein